MPRSRRLQEVGALNPLTQSCMFLCSEDVSDRKKKIIMTRSIFDVESSCPSDRLDRLKVYIDIGLMAIGMCREL
jgi:hypothetical protein